MAYQPLTEADFDALGLAGWRYVDRRIEATFEAPSFPAAGELVRAIAHAAEAADHHPDVDLRYPGAVKVMLTTHATGGLTTHDTDLAAAIDRLASDAGATTSTEG